MSEMYSVYKDKIVDGNEWLALRSLNYFEDADKESMPKMYIDITWDKRKEKVLKELKNYM